MAKQPQQKLKRSPTEHTDRIRSRVLLIMKSVMVNHPTIRNRKAFAKAIYTGAASISRWENNTGNPTPENLADICELFSVSPYYLLLGKGTPFGESELLNRIIMLEEKVQALEKMAGITTSRKKVAPYKTKIITEES